jgi:hypothetical protein
VVRADPQAVDAVGAGVVRAEDDDAQLLPLLAQALDQRQAADEFAAIKFGLSLF